MKGSLFYRDNYWTKVRSGKFLMTTGDCAVKSVLQTTGNREHYGLMVLVRATSPVSRSSQARASLVLTRPRRPGQQQTTLSHSLHGIGGDSAEHSSAVSCLQF